MTPTEEQTHILDLAKSSKSNIMIRALAGTGKTSTLEMIERHISTRPILYLVFNKRNAEEAEKRMLSTTTVRTFNSLGHRIWAKACGRNLRLDSKKTTNFLREIIQSLPRAAQAPVWDSYWEIVDGVAKAKAFGYIPNDTFPTARRLLTREQFHASLDEEPDELVADLIDEVLIRSIKAAYEGLIDFNDQIYMPALFGGTYPQFPLVKVDEYQDLNAVNHAMLDKLLRNSRLIGVGDPWQNIYGFRGAKAQGMAEAEEKYSATIANLSISFRCPEAIVKAAQWHVPHFRWLNSGGEVHALETLQASSIPDRATIICRNNAPLFRTAMRLLAIGRSVQVAGSDIGPKLIGLLRRMGDEDSNKVQVLSSIEDWLAERVAKGNSSAIDLAECMKVFVEHGNSLGQAIRYAEHLFAQEGTIRLLTGHKAKGLEFNVVYHLDPWLLGAGEQELNLRYVITTRSRDKLYEIDSKDIRW